MRPTDIGFWIATAAAVVGAFYSGLTFHRARVENVRSVNPKQSRVRIWPVAALAVVAWAAVGFDYYDRHFSSSSDAIFPNPDMEYLGFWGGGPDYPAGVSVQVKGHLLMRFEEKYRIVAAAFHHMGVSDVEDDEFQLKSGEHDIAAAPINIRLPFQQNFVDELNKGIRNTSYVILLIPKGISQNQFNTLREAKNLGGIVVESRGGPP